MAAPTTNSHKPIYLCEVCRGIVYDDKYSHHIATNKKIVCCTKGCFKVYQLSYFRSFEHKEVKKPKPVKKGHTMGNTNSNIQKINKAIQRIQRK